MPDIPDNGTGAFVLHVRDALIDALSELEEEYGCRVQAAETSTLDKLPALTLWPAGPRLPMPGSITAVDQTVSVESYSWDMRVFAPLGAGTTEALAQDVAVSLPTDAARLLGDDPTLGGLVRWVSVEPASTQVQAAGQTPELVAESRVTVWLHP